MLRIGTHTDRPAEDVIDAREFIGNTLGAERFVRAVAPFGRPRRP